MEKINKIISILLSIILIIINILNIIFTQNIYINILLLIISILLLTSNKIQINISKILIIILIIILNYNNTNNIKIKDFTNKKVIELLEYAQKNNIQINQDYEYSDLIDKYKIIYQTYNKNKNQISFSVSQGPSPYKEINIPDLTGKKDTDVQEYINNNKLSNIQIEYIEDENDLTQETLLEQSKIGILKRNEEIKFTFSKIKDQKEVKLKDLTNINYIDLLFYLKKNNIDYELEYDFSNSIEKDHVIKQSIEKNTIIKDKLKVTLSKGKSIKVIELKNKQLNKIIPWSTKNNIKIVFTSSYSKDIKKGYIISSDKNKDDIIEENSTINLVVSKGQIKLKKQDSLNSFTNWADKNNIKYNIEYTYDDNTKEGDIIKYSQDINTTIDPDNQITVYVSIGNKIEMPNLIGLSKDEATKKLDNLNLKYTFTYSTSSRYDKNYVISQSIKANSTIKKDTTITLKISTGISQEKKETKNTTSNNQANSNNTQKENDTPKENNTTKEENKEEKQEDKKEEKQEEEKTTTCIDPDDLNMQAGDNAQETISMINQLNPNHNYNFTIVKNCPNGSTSRGQICSISKDNCKITIVE